MKISEMTAKFKDLRSMRGRRYRHGSLIGLISYGICSGCGSAESMWRFATERLCAEKLKKLGFKNDRLPCARTLRRAMEKNGVCLKGGGLSGRVLHMDGKTSRRAKGPGETAPHMINLTDGETGKLVGQEACESGAGTELAAAEEMLKKIDVKGAVITA